MELTRRDAIAALAATGVVGSGTYLVAIDGDRGTDSNDGGEIDDGRTAVVETAAALAPVLYPSRVTGAESFVRTYVTGRIKDDDAHCSGMTDAVTALDGHANDEFGARFRDLSPDEVSV